MTGGGFGGSAIALVRRRRRPRPPAQPWSRPSPTGFHAPDCFVVTASERRRPRPLNPRGTSASKGSSFVHTLQPLHEQVSFASKGSFRGMSGGQRAGVSGPRPAAPRARSVEDRVDRTDRPVGRRRVGGLPAVQHRDGPRADHRGAVVTEHDRGLLGDTDGQLRTVPLARGRTADPSGSRRSASGRRWPPPGRGRAGTRRRRPGTSRRPRPRRCRPSGRPSATTDRPIAAAKWPSARTAGTDRTACAIRDRKSGSDIACRAWSGPADHDHAAARLTSSPDQRRRRRRPA